MARRIKIRVTSAATGEPVYRIERRFDFDEPVTFWIAEHRLKELKGATMLKVEILGDQDSLADEIAVSNATRLGIPYSPPEAPPAVVPDVPPNDEADPVTPDTGDPGGSAEGQEEAPVEPPAPVVIEVADGIDGPGDGKGGWYTLPSGGKTRDRVAAFAAWDLEVPE